MDEDVAGQPHPAPPALAAAPPASEPSPPRPSASTSAGQPATVPASSGAEGPLAGEAAGGVVAAGDGPPHARTTSASGSGFGGPGGMDQEEADAAAALLGFGVDPPEGGGFGSDGEAMGGGGGCMPGGMPGLIPINPDEPEYLVKWVGRAHAHNEWVRESTLMGLARRKLLNFKKRHGASPCNSVKEEWMVPERFVVRRPCPGGPGWEVLVKWTGLGYENATWEVRGEEGAGGRGGRAPTLHWVSRHHLAQLQAAGL